MMKTAGSAIDIMNKVRFVRRDIDPILIDMALPGCKAAMRWSESVENSSLGRCLAQGSAPATRSRRKLRDTSQLDGQTNGGRLRARSLPIMRRHAWRSKAAAKRSLPATSIKTPIGAISAKDVGGRLKRLKHVTAKERVRPLARCFRSDA
jgi:hypothetical protein